MAIGVNMFRTGTLNYVRGRLIVLDYASLRGGRGRTPGRHERPRRLRAPTRGHESPTEKTLYVVEHVESTAGTYRFWSLERHAR